MSKKAEAKKRRRDKRTAMQMKRRDRVRLKEWGATHLGYAIYGDQYDPAIHGTPY